MSLTSFIAPAGRAGGSCVNVKTGGRTRAALPSDVTWDASEAACQEQCLGLKWCTGYEYQIFTRLRGRTRCILQRLPIKQAVPVTAFDAVCKIKVRNVRLPAASPPPPAQALGESAAQNPRTHLRCSKSPLK